MPGAIGDLDAELIALPGGAHVDLAAGRRVLERVRHEVGDGALQLALAREHAARRVGLDQELHVGAAGLQPERGHPAADRGRQLERRGRLAAPVEGLRDELQRLLGRGPQREQVVAVERRAAVEAVLRQQRDGRQRVAQVVGHLAGGVDAALDLGGRGARAARRRSRGRRARARGWWSRRGRRRAWRGCRGTARPVALPMRSGTQSAARRWSATTLLRSRRSPRSSRSVTTTSRPLWSTRSTMDMEGPGVGLQAGLGHDLRLALLDEHHQRPLRVHERDRGVGEALQHLVEPLAQRQADGELGEPLDARDGGLGPRRGEDPVGPARSGGRSNSSV
ncbi:MAG: hypothetical protein R3F59_35875 [Myxococcota bacterium]